MGIIETLIVYAALGVMMATVAYVREQQDRPSSRLVGLVSVAIFWPVFAPAFLGRAAEPHRDSVTGGGDFAARIDKAEHRLTDAVVSLNDVARAVLRPQVERFDHLVSALRAADVQVAEMRRLLASAEFDPNSVKRTLAELVRDGRGADSPRVRSLEARLRNIDLLASMERRASDEIEHALLKIEEMTSRILMLRFAGEPEARLSELSQQLSSSIDDLSSAVIETTRL